MLVSKLIEQKRYGGELSGEQIRSLIDGFTSGEVADYQMSAFAMAVCIRGMSPDEISALTLAMLDSGEQLSREPEADVPRVDKHSTGGLGDKVSLVLAPMLACCDLHVPMISGRGLGLTGGTLDKLEAIDGYQTQQDDSAVRRLLEQVGCCIIGAGPTIAPADRKLYALRDVTGTVASTALITASILSKKLAANLDALVLDVKVGGGAFMQSVEQARELADSLQRVGALSGLKTSVLISDMDQPLGKAVGNAIEINESLEVLSGPTTDPQLGRVRELCIDLGAMLLLDSGRESVWRDARRRLAATLDGGHAFERFHQMVSRQSGNLAGPLPIAQPHSVVSHRDGIVASIDCVTIGETVVALGGGRRRAEDTIDPSVGVLMNVTIGDEVRSGQELVRVHCRSELTEPMETRLRNAVAVVETPVARPPLVIERRSSSPDSPNFDE